MVIFLLSQEKVKLDLYNLTVMICANSYMSHNNEYAARK